MAETSSINAIGIRKDWPILQDIIQKAMDDVSASERLDLFREWVKPEIIDNTASSQGEMISPSETQPKSMTDTHIALRFIVFAVMFGVACVIIYRNMEKRPLASLLSGVTSVVGRRWIVTFNIVFISIVLTLGAWVLEVVEQNEKQDTKERLETIIRGTTEAMNLWVQQKIRTTVNVARDQDLIRMSELLLEQKKLGYQSDLTLYTFYYENLHKRLILQSSGEGYNIIAPDYSVLLSSYEELIGTRSRAATHQPEILARAFDGEAVVIPAFPSASYHAEHSKVTGLKDGPVMFIAAPIKKGDEVIAVLALYEDPQKGFSRINQLGRSGYSGETYSFDRDGRMMTRSRFLAQLHQDGTIPANEQEIYSLVLRDPRYRLESEVHPVDRKRAYTKAVREALEGRNGADLDGYYNYLGEEVFGAWIWSDKLNLGFVTEIQKVEAMTSYRNVRILILVILSLISLASIAGTSLLLYFAVRSNKNLEQARRYLEKRVKERTENLELAKSEIEQAEARLSAILDNMTEAVVIISDRGVIQRFSIIAETMFGYRADEVIGHNVSILMPPATANAHDGYLENYRHSGKPQVMGYVREVIAKRRNNSEFLAELSVTELKLKNERIFIGVIRDITRRKEMEQEILFAKDKAEAASEAKTAFLATMSHELKTPLNAIICYSEMLEEEAEEIEQSDVFIPDLKRIHASGQHLLHMINEILNLSKLDAGQEKLHVESFDIRQMIRSVEDDMSPMHEKNGNTFLLNFGADLTTTTADLVKSRQILLNLLSNATKFTQNGVVTLTVSLVEEQGKKFVSYKVADTGIGMSEEQQQKVFDPFVQAEETTTRKYGGTGLGLPIVKRYCEMMGGSVSVESEEGKGASFTVLLPDEIK